MINYKLSLTSVIAIVFLGITMSVLCYWVSTLKSDVASLYHELGDTYVRMDALQAHVNVLSEIVLETECQQEDLADMLPFSE